MRIAALLLMLLCAPAGASGEPLRIAVAANFKPTLEEINRLFESRTGLKASLSSASTGILANQIHYGAPFDLFFAADSETPQKLSQLSSTAAFTPFCYAVGSLVLAGGDGSLAPLSQQGLSVAIANPATAPYGRAAMEVLQRQEFRAGAGRKLVRGNSALQAYQFWHSGAVDLALLPRALAPPSATPIPRSWHQPLQQHALVLQDSPVLDAYLKWFGSDTVRSLITQAGYQPCP